jgi:hypothetical protein
MSVAVRTGAHTDLHDVLAKKIEENLAIDSVGSLQWKMMTQLRPRKKLLTGANQNELELQRDVELVHEIEVILLEGGVN